MKFYLSNKNKEVNLNRTYVEENKRFIQNINFKSEPYLNTVDTSELNMEQIVNEVEILDSLLNVNENLMDSSYKELIMAIK